MPSCKECGCGFVTIVDMAVLPDVCDHCQIRLLLERVKELEGELSEFGRVAFMAGELHGKQTKEIVTLRAELEEALDIVECVAHGLKREPHQLQFDAVALLKKRQTTSA